MIVGVGEESVFLDIYAQWPGEILIHKYRVAFPSFVKPTELISGFFVSYKFPLLFHTSSFSSFYSPPPPPPPPDLPAFLQSLQNASAQTAVFVATAHGPLDEVTR